MKTGVAKKVKKSLKAKNGGRAKLKIHKPRTEAGYKAAFSNYAGKEPLEIDAICDSLSLLTDGWPKCISGALCYVEDGELRVLQDASALFAWVGGHAPVEWKRGARAVTKEEFFKRLHQRERWEWATPHPHFPKVPGVYYLTKPPKAENTGKLDELIDRFLPKTDNDRELIKAFVLTLYWGGPPSKRPQFVVAADEDGDKDAGRGTGKTTLVQYLAELVGGCVDVDPSGSRDRILSNLLSPSSWGRRIAFIDNLKTSRFSNDFLERLVTCKEITGHRLYAGFATRPNLLVWAVTVNGAHFSTDESRRSVVIRVDRPSKKPSNWDAETLAFIEEHREAIVADIRWHLEVKEPAPLKKIDSWGPWCMGVLSRCNEPDTLLKYIAKQRKAIDADKKEVELALDHLRGCIISYFQDDSDDFMSVLDINNAVVWAPTAWFVLALRGLKPDMKERQAQQFLSSLTSSPNFEECRTNSQRGYHWIGPDVDMEHMPQQHNIVYRPDVRGTRQRL